VAVTYSPGSLATSARDRIRFRLGDTVTTRAAAECLDDAEIDGVLSISAERSALIQCGRALAARLGVLVDIRVGDYSEKLSDRRKALLEIVAEIESGTLLDSPTALSSCGGISVAETVRDLSNADRLPPAFTTGQFDFDQPSNPNLGDIDA
jgi:hypothetical protein